MNESCFRLVLMYGSCVQCLLKLVLTENVKFLCFARFLLYEGKMCKSMFTGLYKPSCMLHTTL